MQYSRNLKPVKRNWFDTLSEALESEGLDEYWDCTNTIGYGETFRTTLEINGRYHTCVIYRETDGRYERPVHYAGMKIPKELA